MPALLASSRTGSPSATTISRVAFEWAPAARAVPHGLTEAESEVASLLISGLSNSEIAAYRSTSARTVANQVASLFRKLGVSSRLELFAFQGASGPADRGIP